MRYENKQSCRSAVTSEHISYQSSLDPVGVAYSASAFFHFSMNALFTGSSIFLPVIRLLCKTMSGHFFDGSFWRIPLTTALT